MLVGYYLLRIMENDNLNLLTRLVLLAQILDYFLISGVEQTSQEIYISLDEKMNPELIKDVHFESKGFMEAVSATDFPIRGHKVILKSDADVGLTYAQVRASVFPSAWI